jgi:hypothetical protein
VAADGTAAVPAEAEAALAGLNATGALLLQAGGTLQATAAAPVTAAAALRLAADGVAADLNLQAAVATSAGPLSLSAGRDLVLGAAASATAGAQLLAGRDLTLTADLATGASDSQLQAGRDIALGSVDTRGAALALVAGGALIDGDAALDLQASTLSLTSGGDIGAAADALEFDAATLSLASGAGAWLAGAGTTTLTRGAAVGMLLLSTAGDTTVTGAVGAGTLNLQSEGRLELAAAASVASAGGTLRLAALSALSMAEGSTVASGGGEITLAAGGVMTVSRVDAGSGALLLSAAALRDLAGEAAGSAPDLSAARLQATLVSTGGSAPSGLGTAADAIDTAVGRLTADVSGGGVFIQQQGALQIDGLRSAAALVLQAQGSVTGLGAIAAAGVLRLAAQGDAADLRLDGAVSVADGAATLTATRDLVLQQLQLAGNNRSLDLEAGGALLLGEGGSVSTRNGAVWARAGGEMRIESIDAGSGGVALSAARLVDGDTEGDAELDLVAGALSLATPGAIGSAANALELRAATLAARAGAGGLFLAEADGLAVAPVAVAVQRVGGDATLSRLDAPTLEDLAVADSGALVLVLRDGDLRLTGGSATPLAAVNFGSGPVLLQAEGGRLVLESGVWGEGAVSLRAQGDLSFTATGRVQLTGNASIDVQSGANLAMADGSALTAQFGGIRAAATGTLSLGSLTTLGDISLLARSVADSGGDEVDLRADRLRLVTTGGGAGSGALPLQMTVSTLAAQIAGTGAAGLFGRETDALALGAVPALTVQRVAADGSLAALTDTPLADVVSAGNVVLIAGGSISVADGDSNGRGIVAGGNLGLQALGPLGSLVVQPGAALRSSGGHISLQAALEVQLGADLVVERAGRSLEVEAGGRLVQAAGTGIDTAGGAVRLAAGGELLVSRIGAGSGDVALRAVGAIGESGPDDSPEVVAAGLRLAAGGAIGSEADRLELRVGAVSARSGEAVWLDEADGIRVADVAVRVNRVAADGSVTPLDEAVQSDLVTTGGAGTVALSTRAGDIDLTDGSAPADGRAISAFGDATVRLQPGGAGAVLDVPGGAALRQGGAFVLDSGLRLGGAFSVEAGAGGAAADGEIRIAGAIDGTAGGAADTLALRSDGGDVTVLGTVGATQRLQGLRVDGADDVRFAQALRLDGELRIEASGVVRFDGPLDLGAGSLVIVGARQVLLGDVLLASGDVRIDADTLVLTGTVRSDGTAALVWLSSGGGRVGLRVAEGAAAPGAAPELRLDAAALARFVGFDQVRLEALRGGLAVQGESLAALAPGLGLALVARGDVEVGGRLVSSVPLTLSSSTGVLREAGAGDGLTDIVAPRVLLSGLGPLLAPGQSEAPLALDLETARVEIAPRDGSVLRDSGADGRTRFNVLVGDRLHQSAVVVGGTPVREATLAESSAVASGLGLGTGALESLRPWAALRLDALVSGSAWAERAGRLTLDYLDSGDADEALFAAEGLARSWVLDSSVATGLPPEAALQWWPEPALLL